MKWGSKMKNLLMVLASVALLVVILAAGSFGYKSFTEINNSKVDKKEEQVKSKKEKVTKKEDKKEKKNEEQSTEEPTEVVQEQTTGEQSVDENKVLDVNEEIAKADKDGDGVVTTDEMTPELWSLAEQGKFQPISREMAEQNLDANEKVDEPVTDNRGNNIDDMDSEEFLSKYTEGMDSEEAETVRDMAQDDPGYEDFLRGQVEARQNGQGGNY
ncbi:cytoskeletal protein RodZ [Mammaliicoccus sciuri]